MTKVVISYLTKDRAKLTRRTFPALTGARRGCTAKPSFDVLWIDGSDAEGRDAPAEFLSSFPPDHEPLVFSDIRGGADAAIVFALTKMLECGYDIIGLCENDVLLHDGWFEATMALFEKGKADGLCVGAVSPRCYVDRILIQRDGYAIAHNLGAGIILFTREAARLVLDNYRTGWWHDNRALFAQLSGIDIGRYAAFRGNEQWTSADWHFDAVLAQAGFASLATTPSLCEMIGQKPSLAEQGLILATGPRPGRFNPTAFDNFADMTADIRSGCTRLEIIKPIHFAHGTYTHFPQQIPHVVWNKRWVLQWSQGFGPFAWRATENDAHFNKLLLGPATFLVSGGKHGAKVSITDTDSGYEVHPDLPAGEMQIAQLQVPGGMSYREIVMTCSAGAVFYGVQTTEPQPIVNSKFDYHSLPPV